MAKSTVWQDDYWLMLMQIYLHKPVGVKPLYSREMIDLSVELHIAPQILRSRMQQIATLETPRIERIWRTYADNPRKLARAVKLLREMKGFGSAGDFFQGVEVQETFEKDFRPLAEDERFTPVMLILILDLYFCLSTITMVEETPEVQELAKLLKLKSSDIVMVLDVFQTCDPYLNREASVDSALLLPCQQIWQRYGNMEPHVLAAYAEELKEYFRS
ncbi:hypothetical protein L6466_01295 [Prevotella communis]|uniref:Uncharacterized protein n=1 Tax=Prevotella communis TaxID=2913614 RepID=A0A1H0K4J3_9BACT|nr:hypothetical protein [Prevotella communis]UKK59201.1 hypothetical protein L6470_12675 [Prevotella communis]UKK67170.1 hypothetical protein L6464_11195 [Prevotella communis]UKK70691.1 hypothetical protein L6466_01295 [Prevotella communis]SDO50693.1 hypothetical protein SAMN04487900_12319 [Prevotella communis]